MTRFRLLSLRTSATAVALGAFVCLGAACSGDDSEVPAAPPDNPQLVAGEKVWAANCTSCHGKDGGGISGPALNNDVAKRYPDVEDQIRVVTDGKGSMPSFGRKLSEEEIQAVVAYTREVL